MITQLSKNLSSFFVVHGVIHEEDRDVYSYSLEILLSTLQSLIAIAILAVISRTVLETTLFLVGFVPLRLIAGGYHAKSHFRCFLILMFVYAVFLVILFFIPDGYVVLGSILSAILSVLLVFFFAPSEDSNKPVSSEERVRFKKKSRITIVGYATLIGLVVTFTQNSIYTLSVAIGTITVGLSLIANKIKNRKQNQDE